MATGAFEPGIGGRHGQRARLQSSSKRLLGQNWPLDACHTSINGTRSGQHGCSSRARRSTLARLSCLKAFAIGSILAVARDLGISYRTAWVLLDRIDQAFIEGVVMVATGGAHSGGANLTPVGD